MNPIRTLATGAVACLLLGGAMAGPAAADVRSRTVFASGPLADLSTATVDVTDGARGAALAFSLEGKGTFVFFTLTGLDRALKGGSYGAHIHTGPCQAGNPAAAGPHYNSTGGAVVSAETEVWLDISVSPWGTGFAYSHVPFTIPPGSGQSIVVHAMPTSPAGTAGGRLACLPLGI